MKRIIFSILAISALLLSCKNQNEPQQPLTPVTLDVCADGASLQFNIDGEQQMVHTKNVTPHAMPAALRMILAGKRE